MSGGNRAVARIRLRNRRYHFFIRDQLPFPITAVNGNDALEGGDASIQPVNAKTGSMNGDLNIMKGSKLIEGRLDIRVCRSGARCALMLLFALGLGGCATSVTVTPRLSGPTSRNCEIHAPVRYDGNPEYLPTVLVRDATVSQALTLRYRYDINYDAQPLPDIATLVNPLTIFGFPTGHDYISVVGSLEVIRADATVRSYGAAAALKRTGTVFGEGDSFTDMRRRGLLLVRDNISVQLCQDRTVLTQLLGAGPDDHSSSQQTPTGERP